MNAPPRTRFTDTGAHWYLFASNSFVRCPKCAWRATSLAPAEGWLSPSPWRLVCGHCGLVSEKPLTAWCKRDPVDPAFGCALWLQTPCCGHTLWAFNGAHLSLIERFIGADLREAYEGPDGRVNGTVASRLPRWMIGAHRRDDVLRACGRLRDLLGADAPS